MSVQADVVIPGKVRSIPSTGLASDALPEVQQAIKRPICSQKGVSTKNALSSTASSSLDTAPGSLSSIQRPTTDIQRSPLTVPHWYALRTTYGREQLAYDYITSHGGTAYWPTMEQTKEVNGKRRKIRVSRIPNILFAYGTLLEVQAFVYDNVNLPFLRFYYAKETIGREIVSSPLVVPERQIESLRIVCAVDDGNITIVPQTETRFSKGQQVRIVQGRFAGVTGHVARYQGQQRVAVIVEGLFTIATAYIPSAFLVPIND